MDCQCDTVFYATPGLNVIPYTISLVYRQKSLHIVVCHRTDAGIRPYIFGGFHHVDDGIDGQDDAQNGNGGTDA